MSVRETILRLVAGEEAPAGMEILRLLGTFERPTGTGTNTELVYVVVVRPIEAIDEWLAEAVAA